VFFHGVAALRTDEFDFQLPQRLIAQHPSERRGASRLLHVCGNALHDRQFGDLPGLVREHDLLVLNDTRVLKARLFGTKQSGGRVEVMVERLLGEHEVLAQIRASKPPKPGSKLKLAAEGSPRSSGAPTGGANSARPKVGGGLPAFGVPLAGAEHLPVTVLGREGEFYRLRFDSMESVPALLERYGRLPLPPYITHAADAGDEERYQTVFARQPGAVAAPTAGLHFDEAMLDALRARGAQIGYVTLHVGAGTFQPVRAENIEEHTMHSERYAIPQETVEAVHQAQARGGRVIAVGTTSLRALESAAMQGELVAGERETDIFITPGYRFKVVDVLLTNFHLPRSTLLMLVCAFGGMNEMLAAYRHAVEREYRFFSYGDAMLIECRAR
jgi:S-adenosylmethionine:tRNA ribosyltransferase-isomerase